jgi:hypothetical protein
MAVQPFSQGAPGPLLQEVVLEAGARVVVGLSDGSRAATQLASNVGAALHALASALTGGKGGAGGGLDPSTLTSAARVSCGAWVGGWRCRLPVCLDCSRHLAH